MDFKQNTKNNQNINIFSIGIYAMCQNFGVDTLLTFI